MSAHETPTQDHAGTIRAMLALTAAVIGVATSVFTNLGGLQRAGVVLGALGLAVALARRSQWVEGRLRAVGRWVTGSRAAATLSITGLIAGILLVLVPFGQWSSSPKSAKANEPFDSAQPNAGATCESLERQLAVTTAAARRFRADSPGQLSGGAQLLARLVPSSPSSYARILHVTGGDVVELSLELHNTEYGTVQNPRVEVDVPFGVASCWSIGATETANEPDVPAKADPIFLLAPKGRKLRVSGVAGSTVLLDNKGQVLSRLPDGIGAKILNLPFAVPGGATQFVNFKLRISDV